MSFENIVFYVDGGLGKNIMATVVLRAIKKKFPDKKVKVIVICGFTEAFYPNPNAHRVFHFSQTQYFYEDYIKNSKSLILRQDPYYEFDCVYPGNKHFTQAWCELFDLEWDNAKPDLFFTNSEIAEARQVIESRKRPVLLMQLTGGIVPQSGQPTMKMYTRNLPMDIADKLVKKLKDKFHIMAIAGPNQIIPKDTERVTHRFRNVMALAFFSKKVLLIDSFMQHACAAIDKEAVVLWGGTSPKLLGYKIHKNMFQIKCPTPFCNRPNSFLFDTTPYGVPWECEHSDVCMEYSVDDIIKILDVEGIKKSKPKCTKKNCCKTKKKK